MSCPVIRPSLQSIVRCGAYQFLRPLSTLQSPTLPNTSIQPPPKYQGPNYEDSMKSKAAFLSPALKPFYRSPLLITDGRMQWLYDHSGRRYLDMFAGILTVGVGHCHPRVVAALTKQSKKLWHTASIYSHPMIVEYAEKLVSTFPDPLKVAFFVNSGSEANDMALLLARLYTGKNDVVAFRGSYHGMTLGALTLTSLPGNNYPISHRHGIIHTMTPDPYRGAFGGSHCRDPVKLKGRNCACDPNGSCQATQQYIHQMNENITHLTGGSVAGFIFEGLQGVGGAVQYTKGFLKEATKLVKDKGGVNICDEVQAGLGRTGSHFWSFEAEGVIPDIVTMAKGVGNGFPLGAVVTTKEIAAGLATRSFYNTYGGNPLACAVGKEVLEVIEEEGLQENCRVQGDRLIKGLCELREDFEIVGDVRGKGLMVAMEMVENKETNAPLNQNRFMDIHEATKDMGLLIGKGGVNGNVFRIKPPMCITKEDVDFTLEVLRSAIKGSS